MKVEIKGTASNSKSYKVGVIDLTSNKIARHTTSNWNTPKANMNITQELSKVITGSAKSSSAKRAETAKKPVVKKDKLISNLAKPAKYQVTLRSTTTS